MALNFLQLKVTYPDYPLLVVSLVLGIKFVYLVKN
jgi:hypothetical protein